MDDRTDTTRTVRSQGVTVRKTVTPDGTVRLEVDAERDTGATVRLIDPALESIPDEDLQLDAEAGAEWTIEGSSALEGTFDPDETRTVWYHVGDADPETLEAEPRLSVRDGSNLGAIADRTRSDTLREFVGGERDSLGSVSGGADPAEAEAEDTDASIDRGETESAVETALEGGAVEDSVAEATAESATDEVIDGSGTDTDDEAADRSEQIARTLLAELRNGHVDAETATALRSELGVGGRRSLQVRLDHLQSEVGDLAAYTDTIESFIDRHGTFDSVVDDVHAELAALEERTERVESTLQARSDTVDRIDDVESELRGIRSAQSELESELETIGDAHAEFDARFDRLEEELSTVNDRLEEIERFNERLSGALLDLGSDDET